MTKAPIQYSTHKKNSYIRAARLRTLPLSLSGIILGAFLAASKGVFDPIIFLWSVFTTLGFQVLSNFANDYGDGVKGTDNDSRAGPSRMIQSGLLTPKQLLNAIKIVAATSLISSMVLVYVAFGLEYFTTALIFMGLALFSIWAAVKYTMGKNPYGYSGLGDLAVFLFFGLLGVCGSYFLYAKSLNLEMLLPASSVGFLSASVLNLNNMRDYTSDTLANKRTLVVKMGQKNAKYYHYFLLLLPLIFAILYVLLNYQSLFNFLFLLAYVPIGVHFYTVLKNKNPEMLDPELKKMSIYTLLFAVLFGVGVLECWFHNHSFC